MTNAKRKVPSGFLPLYLRTEGCPYVPKMPGSNPIRAIFRALSKTIKAAGKAADGVGNVSYREPADCNFGGL